MRDPASLDRPRMAIVSAFVDDLPADIDRCREIAMTCLLAGERSSRVEFIERGLTDSQALRELHDRAFGPRPKGAPFPLLLADPGLRLVKYDDDESK